MVIGERRQGLEKAYFKGFVLFFFLGRENGFSMPQVTGRNAQSLVDKIYNIYYLGCWLLVIRTIGYDVTLDYVLKMYTHVIWFLVKVSSNFMGFILSKWFGSAHNRYFLICSGMIIACGLHIAQRCRYSLLIDLLIMTFFLSTIFLF